MRNIDKKTKKHIVNLILNNTDIKIYAIYVLEAMELLMKEKIVI